jgi:hypothetical protein
VLSGEGSLRGSSVRAGDVGVKGEKEAGSRKSLVGSRQLGGRNYGLAGQKEKVKLGSIFHLTLIIEVVYLRT